MIDITLPISMTFTIDGYRVFHKPENVKIISNCPAPLKTRILSINKSSLSPSLVSPTKYTDYQWNNLTKAQTFSEMALILNTSDLSTSGVEIGNLKSAFRQPQTLDLDLSAKYGKAWNNKVNLTFTYNIQIIIKLEYHLTCYQNICLFVVYQEQVRQTPCYIWQITYGTLK